jgi:hypothetical protein
MPVAAHRSVLLALAALATTALSLPADAEVLSAPPESPLVERQYIFYLHGRIIEDQGVRPTHPTFGVYEYRGILQRLAATGAVVISERRAANTGVSAYADRVVAQIQELLQAGVAPSHIGVIGFSKGGAIAVNVASRLPQREVRYVFQAACGFSAEELGKLQPHGRILAIHEKSDTMARSCKELNTSAAAAFSPIEIATGKDHGAFYQTNAAWMVPTLRWLIER